jgi:hypothetical protein
MLLLAVLAVLLDPHCPTFSRCYKGHPNIRWNVVTYARRNVEDKRMHTPKCRQLHRRGWATSMRAPTAVEHDRKPCWGPDTCLGMQLHSNGIQIGNVTMQMQVPRHSNWKRDHAIASAQTKFAIEPDAGHACTLCDTAATFISSAWTAPSCSRKHRIHQQCLDSTGTQNTSTVLEQPKLRPTKDRCSICTRPVKGPGCRYYLLSR